MPCGSFIATSSGKIMVNILIVTHGEFGAYLSEAAEEIVGRQGEGIRVVSTSARLSIKEIRSRVSKAIREIYDENNGLVVITDMVGGTPTNVALPLVRDLPNVSVISGLNLYMLVSAFSRRKTGDRLDVVAAMLNDGQRSIQDVGEKILSHAHNARPD